MDSGDSLKYVRCIPPCTGGSQTRPYRRALFVEPDRLPRHLWTPVFTGMTWFCLTPSETPAMRCRR